VEVTILLPLPVYDAFLDKCDQSSREYAILKNGLIFRQQKEDHYERIVRIQCDLEDANKLLSLAIKIFPDAVADISKGITLSLKPPPSTD
jgi:hypothetical protein